MPSPVMEFLIPFYPAHGALGYWDEIIFLSIIVIFLVMMGVSWFRSRSMDFDDELTPAPKPKETVHPGTSDDARFELD